MIAVGRGISEDELTRQVTERAKEEVARDFATWLRSGGADELAGFRTRSGKVVITEGKLARLVARTTLALGDYVARGALIDFAEGLSDYADPDTFAYECVHALKREEANR